MPEQEIPFQLNEEAQAALAAKFKAEAREHDALARKAEAEADERRAQADREVALHRKWTIHNEEELSVLQAKDRFNGSYPFHFKVADGAVNECIDWLNLQHRKDPTCPLEVVFYSPGGEIMPGMRLFDHIRWLSSQNHKMTTVAMGYAASMGGVLLQAGDVRKMGAEAYLLIHEVSFGVGGSIGEVEDEVEFVKKIQNRIINIFCERAKGTGRKGYLTPQFMRRKWKRKDWWLDSDECYKLGIVDEVL